MAAARWGLAPPTGGLCPGRVSGSRTPARRPQCGVPVAVGQSADRPMRYITLADNASTVHNKTERKTTMRKLCDKDGGENNINPRPAGVWLVTRPAGGGPKGPPPEISQTTGPISKFQTPFDSPVRELPVQGQIFDPEVTDDVTGQVKVRIFRLFGLGDIGE